MRKIALWATKGGVGKTTLTASLARALRDLGFKVGAMDLDITSTGLHKAFSLPGDLRLGLDTSAEKMLPIEKDGVKLFCLAWKLTEDVCVGWREEGKKMEVLGEKKWFPGRKDFLEEVLTKTVEWGDLDFLLYDLPPSSGTDTWVFFDQAPDLYGIIAISQPSAISVVGLKKTIDFIKREQRPILGLVENMASFICPECGKETYPFTSDRIDLKEFARKAKIPFLCSIPQCPDMERLEPHFRRLAEEVLNAEPKVLRQDVFSMKDRLERGIIKGVLRI